jgi:hypothetical protein
LRSPAYAATAGIAVSGVKPKIRVAFVARQKRGEWLEIGEAGRQR